MIPALPSQKKFIHQFKAEYLRRFNNQEEHEPNANKQAELPVNFRKALPVEFLIFIGTTGSNNLWLP